VLEALIKGWEALGTEGPLLFVSVLVFFVVVGLVVGYMAVAGMRKSTGADSIKLNRGGSVILQVAAAIFFGLLFGPNQLAAFIPGVTLVFGFVGLFASVAIMLLITGVIVWFTRKRFKVFAITYGVISLAAIGYLTSFIFRL